MSQADSGSLTGALPRGFRRGASGFDSQLASYLHRRLRIAAIVVFAVVLLDLLANAALYVFRDHLHGFVHGSTFVLYGGTLVAGGFVLLLRRRGIGLGGLQAIDAMLFLAAIGVASTFYAMGYRRGAVMVVPILGLLLLTRAVVVPSRPLRTFVITALAGPPLLAVALVNGPPELAPGLPMAHGEWISHTVFTQVYVLLAALVATVASAVNFRLRLSAWEATEIGQYQLEGKLGEGSMGEVHRARHALLRRPTAVKVIRADLMGENALRRFEHEVRQTARLTHPNTVAVYDYGRSEDGVFYYAMELVDGADLETIVTEDGPFPPGRVIHVLAQALGALAEAHDMGLVHRDVKPGNIMLSVRGGEPDVVKVMDFGLVKDTRDDPGLTVAGQVCGTPTTISPEAVRSREVGPAADLYSLGCVGCWLLTGRHLFDAETAIDFVTRHLNEAPIPPSARGVDVPPDLEKLLLSCLEKSPADRPGSARELRAALLASSAAGEWTAEDAAAWWARRNGRHELQVSAPTDRVAG